MQAQVQHQLQFASKNKNNNKMKKKKHYLCLSSCFKKNKIKSNDITIRKL